MNSEVEERPQDEDPEEARAKMQTLLDSHRESVRTWIAWPRLRLRPPRHRAGVQTTEPPCPVCAEPLAVARLTAERVDSAARVLAPGFGVHYRYCPSDDLVVFLRGGVFVGTERETVRAPGVREALANAVVGSKVQFAPDVRRRRWDVRARNDRFIVATHQDEPLTYTVVDLTGWQRTYNGVGPGVVRSSLNTLGGGWDLGPDGEGCDDILAGITSGKWSLSNRRVCAVESVEVSA